MYTLHVESGSTGSTLLSLHKQSGQHSVMSTEINEKAESESLPGLVWAMLFWDGQYTEESSSCVVLSGFLQTCFQRQQLPVSYKMRMEVLHFLLFIKQHRTRPHRFRRFSRWHCPNLQDLCMVLVRQHSVICLLILIYHILSVIPLQQFLWEPVLTLRHWVISPYVALSQLKRSCVRRSWHLFILVQWFLQ